MADKPSVRVLHRAVDSDDDEQHSSQSGSPQQSLQELKASNDSLKQRLEQVCVCACLSCSSTPFPARPHAQRTACADPPCAAIFCPAGQGLSSGREEEAR